MEENAFEQCLYRNFGGVCLCGVRRDYTLLQAHIVRETVPVPLIGVAQQPRCRRCGMGSRFLSERIHIAKERFHPDKLYLEAQVYAKSFYEKQGFQQISEEFLEDGIPHIKMLLDGFK